MQVFHSTTKSRLGHTLGATSVQMQSKKVAQDIETRTQNPKSLLLITPVVKLTDIQLVTSIDTYMDAMHIQKCHLAHCHDYVYFASLLFSVSSSSWLPCFAASYFFQLPYPYAGSVDATPIAWFMFPSRVTFTLPVPPMMDPYMVSTKKKVLQTISDINEPTSIRTQTWPG